MLQLYQDKIGRMPKRTSLTSYEDWILNKYTWIPPVSKANIGKLFAFLASYWHRLLIKKLLNVKGILILCLAFREERDVLFWFWFVGVCSSRACFITIHSAPLIFLTKTKKSKAETPFPIYYDAKQVRINQEKHMLSGFPLSHQLSSAGQAALEGRLAGTG